jgi:hypothetical protein
MQTTPFATEANKRVQVAGPSGAFAPVFLGQNEKFFPEGWAEVIPVVAPAAH